MPQAIKLTIWANVRVGERTAQSGGAVRCHSCPLSLALALLATLGSATSIADPLTCHGWLNANDSAVNNPYNATLIQLTPADMPIEQIITQLLPELVRECSEQAQLGFASTVKRALLALDAPTPQVQEVAPAPPASEIVATKPPDLEVVAPEPPSPAPHTIRKPHQSNHKSRKPSQGHDHQTRLGGAHTTGPGG
jgi:outer membrane biosynthesis protein TonB